MEIIGYILKTRQRYLPRYQDAKRGIAGAKLLERKSRTREMWFGSLDLEDLDGVGYFFVGSVGKHFNVWYRDACGWGTKVQRGRCLGRRFSVTEFYHSRTPINQTLFPHMMMIWVNSLKSSGFSWPSWSACVWLVRDISSGTPPSSWRLDETWLNSPLCYRLPEKAAMGNQRRVQVFKTILIFELLVT